MSKKAPIETITPPLEPQERRRQYNKAVREAQLVNIYLSLFTFKVNRNLKQPAKPVGKYNGNVLNCAFVKERGLLLATIAWDVEIKVRTKNYVKCVAHYDIAYDGLLDLHEEIVSLLGENMARPATYAYFRALFANVDWAANLRSPPLPVVKFYPDI